VASWSHSSSDTHHPRSRSVDSTSVRRKCRRAHRDFPDPAACSWPPMPSVRPAAAGARRSWRGTCARGHDLPGHARPPSRGLAHDPLDVVDTGDRRSARPRRCLLPRGHSGARRGTAAPHPGRTTRAGGRRVPDHGSRLRRRRRADRRLDRRRRRSTSTTAGRAARPRRGARGGRRTQPEQQEPNQPPLGELLDGAYPRVVLAHLRDTAATDRRPHSTGTNSSVSSRSPPVHDVA